MYFLESFPWRLSLHLVPIILLYSFKLLSIEDFSKANWAALILFGGGLSLGSAIHSSGLDLIMANALKGVISGLPIFVIFLCIAAFCIILTSVLSNTASAALIVSATSMTYNSHDMMVNFG